MIKIPVPIFWLVNFVNTDDSPSPFPVNFDRRKQDKYAFEYVADAGPKSVDMIVPKAFKDRHESFFNLANKRLADATGMTHVLRREAAKAR